MTGRVAGAIAIAGGLPLAIFAYWWLAKWTARVYNRIRCLPRGGDE
jgi:hypothetical protein